MADKNIERSSAQVDESLIPYMIHREQDRETVHVAVDPREGVVVRAPRDMPAPAIDRIVTGRGAWIVEQLRRVTPAQGRRPREMKSGETYYYLGRAYRLVVEHGGPADAKSDVHLDGAWLVVPVGETETNKQASIVRWKLIGWYRQQAEAQLPGRVDEWAQRLSVEPKTVKIREHRRGWGACDARGNLRLNWRVIQAPPDLVDYIVAHLLVMLVEDRSRDFWSILGSVLPDYRQRQAALSRLERRLEW